jgi:diadenylate cyclase
LSEFIASLTNTLAFLLARMNWLSLVDLLLVAGVFFILLQLLKDTQALVLLRGVLIIIVLISILNSLEVLPAFSWLIKNALPAMLLAVPVIFAPEIRRTLERLGKAGRFRPSGLNASSHFTTIHAVVNAATRLADRKHGALIILKRLDSLDDYIRTGVQLSARVTPELLLQIFYPNTPLHDGAVIIDGSYVLAAACVLPLSSSGVLTSSPERQMGLRHRAALGISEITDAIAVVVSEESGAISVVQGGRMIRRLDAERLDNLLVTLFNPLQEEKGLIGLFGRLFSSKENKGAKDE